MHEILHALGIFHEQYRNDRDSFVKVVWENVSRGKSNEMKSCMEILCSTTSFNIFIDHSIV